MNKGLRNQFPANGTYLTLREMEVMRLIVAGCLNKEVAARLCISVKTVEKHRAKLYQKLRVDSALALARAGLRTGLITLEIFLSSSLGENIARVGVSGQQINLPSPLRVIAE